MKRHLLSIERSRKDPLGTQHLSHDLNEKPGVEPGEKATGGTGPWRRSLACLVPVEQLSPLRGWRGPQRQHEDHRRPLKLSWVPWERAELGLWGQL